MVVMTVVLVIVVMTVASALAFLVVIVMMVMMLVFVFVLIVLVMMVMLALFVVMMVLVATALAIFIVIVVMMLMLIVVVVMLVMIVVMMSANGASILFDQSFNVSLERGFLLERADKRVYRELVCGGSDDNRIDILLSDERESLLKLCIGGLVGVAEENAACVLDLIAEELTEVLHIHLALVYVNYGNRAVDLGVLKLGSKHGFCNVRELSNSRGLDENAVGRIFLNYLLESLAKVSDERAADASRVHL
jgi:hypothetical protein